LADDLEEEDEEEEEEVEESDDPGSWSASEVVEGRATRSDESEVSSARLAADDEGGIVLLRVLRARALGESMGL
jgi:hypothetical protein